MSTESEVFRHPSAEEVKEMTFTFLNQLQRDRIIDGKIAHEWRANIELDFATESAHKNNGNGNSSNR